MKASLSYALGDLAQRFGAFADTGFELQPKATCQLAEQLATLRDMAVKMEAEVTTFRLLEADHAGRSFLEAEAGRVLAAPATTQDGNVFRPDFGRKQ